MVPKRLQAGILEHGHHQRDDLLQFLRRVQEHPDHHRPHHTQLNQQS